MIAAAGARHRRRAHRADRAKPGGLRETEQGVVEMHAAFEQRAECRIVGEEVVALILDVLEPKLEEA